MKRQPYLEEYLEEAKRRVAERRKDSGDSLTPFSDDEIAELMADYASESWQDGYDDGYSDGYDNGDAAGYASGAGWLWTLQMTRSTVISSGHSLLPKRPSPWRCARAALSATCFRRIPPGPAI